LPKWWKVAHRKLCILQPRFHWATIKYFGGLKMRFLKRPETLGSTLRDYLWAHNLHFRGPKTLFLALRETLV
jgi:hypothetical protein